MVEFCGEANPFWDWNKTWNTDDPDFTDCFEETALAWIPCAFLWLLSGLDVYLCLRSRFKHIPWSPLNIAKSAITSLLALLQLILLAYRKYYQEPTFVVTTAEIYTPIIRILTFGLALFLILFAKVKGIRSSGVQYIFWAIMAFCEAFAFRTAIIKSYQIPLQEDTFVFVIKMIFYPFIVCQFFLGCWADAAPKYEETAVLLDKRCPEEAASFLSKILFAWFEGLAWKGYRKPLEYKDLWDLNTEDKSSSLVPIFEKYWAKSVEQTKVTSDAKATFRKRSGSITFKEGNKSSGTKKETSILPTLIKSFGSTFLFGSILKLIHDLLIFVSPQILKLLIAFVSSDGAESDWKGYFYALLLLGASTLQTLILGQYFHRMFLVGMRMRTSLISAIYRKALIISNAARKESTVGEIVNLMSVDAQRLMDLTVYLNMLWSAPLQIGISLYFLWQTLGPSVLAGLAVMILLIPVNAVIASKVKTLQIKQMKSKDIRVKLMNEILSGIKVLKLYAWEPSFQDQVMKVRDKEIKVLKETAYLNAGSSFVWTCAPFLVSLVTFGTYVLVDSNNILDAEKAFVALTLFNIIRMPMSVLPMMIVLSVQVAVVTFATYIYADPANILDAQRAFVSLSLFNILRFPLSMLPMMISSFVQANVSIKRLNKYMSGEEIDPNAVSHEPQESEPIVVENGSFAWEPETTVLKNVNIRIKEGSLTAIVGPVGSGKSSLLSALLGEMDKLTGRVNTKGSIAYCGQQAWIQNATLRDNILFGRPFEPTKYDNIVEACALKPDLEILPGGDKTEIGEKGINLSGGQKQRVSLARAAYNNADTYFLDDPLSAVDSHVGKHIFEKVIGPKGVLKRKTRLLVTHGVTFLPQVDHIIVLKDGEISESGSYQELLDKKGAFAEFLIQHLSSESDDDEDESEIIHDLEVVVGKKVDRQRSKVSESDSTEKGILHRQMSITSQDSTSPKRRMSKSVEKEKSLSVANGVPANNKLIEAEKSETGSVKVDVYMHYLRAIGWQMCFWTMLMQLGFQAFSVLSNVWLSEWSNSNENKTANTTDSSKTDMYLGVYGAFGFGQAFAALTFIIKSINKMNHFTQSMLVNLSALKICEFLYSKAITILIGSILLGLATLKSSSILHLEMLHRIMKAPMSFFDTTPVGRIVNRAAKDVDVCDNTLGQNIRAFLNCFFQVAATLVVISYTTPIFVSVILPTGILYYLVQRFYVATSRQLKRLESVSRSPIYSHFGETLTGCPTIRAYRMNDRFIMESESKVDHNQIAYYPSIISNRWLAIRLETVGNLIIFFAALFTVIQRKVLDPGSVGLSLSYALNITQTLNWLVRMTSEVETNIVAVERIKEYSELPQEASWEVEDRKPNNDWPDNGAIEFKEYQARYRDGLELILKGVSCQVNPAEKIGIVGRTGSGKSTLTLSLFRIIEAAGGQIVIDGQDISKLGLHDVRGRLTIIPQDPVLFSGTLRINLDPFEQYSDETLWRALELSHLKSFVKGLSAGLQHEISEGGENLSVGQRQLICLARALLRKTKILVLDEATAAVDLETDDLIQQTIRTEFKNCTVLTIAHRINTIMDSTRVLVLDKGEIREFDSPDLLLKNKASLFYSMAKDAGLV